MKACPKCGSIKVSRYSNNGLTCDNCGETARSDAFESLPSGDFDYRKEGGFAMASRTIPLSDE